MIKYRAFAKFIAEEQNRQGKTLSIYALMILSMLHDVVDLLKVTPGQAYAVIKKIAERRASVG